MSESRRLGRPLAVAMVFALSVLAPVATSAASCAGASHHVNLSSGKATPSSGTTGTTFTFSVTYQDNGSCAPDRIVVAVNGLAPFTLAYTSGSLGSGATFRATLTLPAGSRSYQFEATSGTGVGKKSVTLKNVNPPTVVVSSPAPKATPKPTSKPAPSPGPTAGPTPGQVSTRDPTPGASGVEPPSPTPSARPTATADQGAFLMARTPDRDDGTRPSIGDYGDGVGDVTFASSTVPATAQSSARPLPWLALLVASVAAFFGLIGFAVLSSSLADPAPRLRSGR